MYCIDMQYLGLVELNFWLKNPWVSTGNCTGNSVGAACGLAAARMLFLLGRSAWYRLGIFRVNSQLFRMKFLHVELKIWTALWALWMNDWNRSGESAGCLKKLGGIPVELDEFCLVYLSLLPFWRISRKLVLHVEVYQDECGFNQPYLLEIWSKTAAILTPCWILGWTELELSF